MIIKANNRAISSRDAMRDGPGSVDLKTIVTKEDMYGKARMFSEIILKENCGIGYHTHENEKEIFVITKGKAIYNDDGKEYEVGTGDVTICEDGHGHGITNKEKEDCVVVALIVLK